MQKRRRAFKPAAAVCIFGVGSSTKAAGGAVIVRKKREGRRLPVPTRHLCLSHVLPLGKLSSAHQYVFPAPPYRLFVSGGVGKEHFSREVSKTSSLVCFIKHSAVVEAAALPTCLGREHFCAIAPTLFSNCFFFSFFKQESQMRIKTA